MDQYVKKLHNILQSFGALDDPKTVENLKTYYSQKNLLKIATSIFLYIPSTHFSNGMIFCIVKKTITKELIILSKHTVPQAIPGQPFRIHDIKGKQCSLNWDTYQEMACYLPFMKPVSLRKYPTTFGCGDRIARATPGHIRACRSYNIHPVLAQQSIRELHFTNRTYYDVVSNAAFSVLQEGFTSEWGADGDHIKEIADIQQAVNAGMPMITLDLSEKIDIETINCSSNEIENRYISLPQEYRTTIETKYAGKTFNLGDISITISKSEAKQCALIFWKALEYTKEIDSFLKNERGFAYDLEISIDETPFPTEMSHHIFIASELNRREVQVTSIAPRFVGDFQKGIDYIGDIEDFERNFELHCKIANTFGGYKISVHSGSDKFSIYPFVGKYSANTYHVKTSGTSWLEAIHTISLNNMDLFRRIVKKAKGYTEKGLQQYHITSDFSQIPPLDELQDIELPKLLENDAARQMLHICYGQMLQDKKMRNEILSFLHSNEESYYRCLQEHFEKHLSLLEV